MYPYILFFHSWLRWGVLLFITLLLIRSLVGWSQGHTYGRKEQQLTRVTTIVFDLQFALGLLLYFFFSPMVKAAFASGWQFMQNPILRFFALEHVTAMVLANAAFHIGVSLSKRAEAAPQKYKRMAIAVMISLLMIAIGIPWPFLPYGRVLIRWL